MESEILCADCGKPESECDCPETEQDKAREIFNATKGKYL